MALGRKYDGDGEGAAGSPVSPGVFRWMVDELFVLNGMHSIGDFIPWLSGQDPQGYVGRMKRLAKMFNRFLEHVVDEPNERGRQAGEESPRTWWTCCWSSLMTPPSRSRSSGMASRDSFW